MISPFSPLFSKQLCAKITSLKSEKHLSEYPYLYKTVTAQNKDDLQLVMFPNLKITFDELFDLGEY